MKYYTSTTEFNCGIDLHSRQMYVCLMDRSGNKLVHTNIQGNDFAYFLKRVEHAPGELEVFLDRRDSAKSRPKRRWIGWR